ncbi:MAG: dihydroorotate dehydrogenase electron transfer subunit [Clostridia bacterium]|nr:dihydroorotate dehydrogenase electron transfer subunit [Clostridia bacterium]
MRSQGFYEIVSNRPLTADTFELRLSGNMDFAPVCGQFVNIKIDGLFLRRPISICDFSGSGFTVIYKIVGAGTGKLAEMKPGVKLDILTGLGNGFDLSAARGRIAVIGGGVGAPPLYVLAKELKKRGADFFTVLGWRDASQVFYRREFEVLAPLHIVTEDGSEGARGFVTDVLRDMEYDYYFTCGPMPMLRAVHRLGKEGQLSFEEKMGCGFGACMGCSCETLAGSRRICTEGPVMKSTEVRFDG